MKNPRLQLSFSRYNDTKFLPKAGFIVTSITSNSTVFKDPDPALPTVTAAIAAYDKALEASEGGGSANAKTKNDARIVVEDLLYLLGLWVMYIAQNQEPVLALSGFDLAKAPQPRKLDGLGNVTLSQGISSGQIDAFVPKGNANSFSFEITDALPTAETAWKIFPVSTSQFTFEGLVPGKQYWIRVAAVGNRKQMVYSNVGTEAAKL